MGTTQRLVTLRGVDEAIDRARQQLQEIRGYTNWHALSPGARIVLRRVRTTLSAARDEIGRLLGEDIDPSEREKLLTRVADWLAEQGYPVTANMLRDGSWEKKT